VLILFVLKFQNKKGIVEVGKEAWNENEMYLVQEMNYEGKDNNITFTNTLPFPYSSGNGYYYSLIS